MAYVINDRRSSALGGQSRDRSRSAITTIGWHYTAVMRKNRAFITNHEAYWRDTLGWDRGGYHFYIDADGNIYQNYDYERITWGVKDSNGYVVHISVEAGNGNDYSQAQIDARDWLTRKIMGDLNIPASKVKGHWEIYNNTSCPGYTKAQMDAFRAKLAKPSGSFSAPVVSTPAVSVPSGGFAVGSKVTVRASATHYQTGQPIASWVKGKTYTIQQVKVVSQSASKRAYLLSDIVSWVLEQDLIPVTAQTAKKPTRWINSGSTLHLPGTVSKWRVYRENGPYTIGNEVGYLNPAKFGGLTYAIKGDRLNDVVVIDTQDFGRVAIYVAPNTGATIKQNWIEVEA